jgi:hypothetical protein
MAIEQGASGGEAGNLLKKILSEDDLGALKKLGEEILQRAGLQDFYTKLKRVS